MENHTTFNDLATDAREYAKLQMEYLKLRAIAKASDVASSAIVTVVISVFAAGVLFFLSFVLAFYLGDRLHSTALGFLIVSGLYFLAAMLTLLLRNKYIKPFLMDSIVKSLNKE